MHALYCKLGSALPALLLIVLTACGSSPPVRYYALSPMDGKYAADPNDAPVLGLGPLRLPEYLKRPQMISRGAAAEIVVDQTARWAEPLEAAVHRILATNVDQLLDDVAVVGFPDTDGVRLDLRLVGRILRFDIDRAGLTVLEVQWRLESGDGTDAGPPRRDRFESRAARAGDPAATTAAMNDALAQFSRAIAAQVRTETGSE